MTYNAQYKLASGSTVIILGIPHLPNFGSVELLPDKSGRYGTVVSVELDRPAAIMRQPTLGPVVEFTGY
jgi:hypothetical protein